MRNLRILKNKLYVLHSVAFFLHTSSFSLQPISVSSSFSLQSGFPSHTANHEIQLPSSHRKPLLQLLEFILEIFLAAKTNENTFL